MCGRFTLTKPGALQAAFPNLKFPELREFSETGLPRYNIAPTQEVLGVRNDGRDTVEELRWGVRGRINIRAESILARRNPDPAALRRVRRRFLRMARTAGRTITRCNSGEPFAFAGSMGTARRHGGVRRRHVRAQRGRRAGSRSHAGHADRR